MKRSPLQVETYFLHELSFEVSEEYDDRKPVSDNSTSFQYFMDFGCHDVKKHKWFCALGVRFKPEVNDNAPYSYKVVLIGYFKVEGNIPSKEAEEKLVHANAPALLYTVAREILSSVSASARWGRIILPTVYFPAVTSAELNSPKSERTTSSSAKSKSKVLKAQKS
ncbi:hypothetical protein GX441_00370 [bacterium]|nr:hypothetical protein [bacterium]